jgi:PTH1 family peptidyl-tRNA hydrolase
MTAIRLLVGLANPGAQYAQTRHNAGAWFIERLAEQHRTTLSPDAKAFGLTARVSIAGEDVRLLIPTTFMNRSGQAVAALVNFYKLTPAEILIAHDELDIAPGQIRLKTGGGHGGHNGLRDSIASLGNQAGFHRLRVGIGHPGNSSQVTGFVLGRAPQSEQSLIDQAIDEALRCTELMVTGDIAKAMNRINSFKIDTN